MRRTEDVARRALPFTEGDPVMRRVLFIAGVIIGLVSAAHAETPFCTSQLDLVNKNLDSLQWVGVAIVTYKIGEQPCFMSGGEIELGSGVAPDFNTVFELVSVTKVFTTAILAMRCTGW
jgi:CubicO group peptidase (beta-lactamase class C family)